MVGIPPSNTQPTINFVQFDYNALTPIYTTGAKLGSNAHAKILANGPLKEVLAQSEISVLPPWELFQPEVSEEALISSILSSQPLIDPNDKLFSRNDVDDSFKDLFAIYKGLLRIGDLTDFAVNNSKADNLRSILQSQFDRYVQEIRDYMEPLGFADIALIDGLRQSATEATLVYPASNLTNVHFGQVITNVRDDPIAGIAGSETFSIVVTRPDSTTQTVNVDLSNVSSTLNADNIVAEINAQLANASGVATRFAVERYDEFQYGLRIDFGVNESIDMTTGTAEGALFVAGTAGAGDLAGAFYLKLDNLAAADPNQFVYENINTLNAEDRGNAIAVDSNGNSYLIGKTSGNLDPNQINTDNADVFLQKYDASGQLLFTRMLGSASDANGFAVTVDSSDNVYIAGQTSSPLDSDSFGGGYDSFITKFDSAGQEQFTRQLSPFANDGAFGLGVDSADNVFISGFSRGSVGGNTHNGGSDAYVTKIDNSGNTIFNVQFGDSGDEVAKDITVDSSGNFYVVGTDDGNGFLRKFDGSGSSASETYSFDLGSLGTGGTVEGVVLDSAGDVLITGSTTNASLASTVVNAHSSGLDGFVFKVDDRTTTAAESYVTYIGTSGTDNALDITIDTTTNNVYISGSTTGQFTGEAQVGSQDAFLTKLSANGALTWTHQFGGAFNHSANALAFDADGTSVLTRLGLNPDKIVADEAQTVTALATARADQFFYVSIDDQARQKITLEVDDSFGFLMSKINAALGTKGKATFSDDVGTRRITIEAQNGGKVELFEGSDEFDLLAPLGLTEVTLYGNPQDGNELELFEQSFFELGIVDGLSVLDTTKAQDADSIILNAQRVIRNAFDFITIGPREDDPIIGPPPEFLAEKILELQGALNALQSFGIPQGNTQPGGLFSLLV